MGGQNTAEANNNRTDGSTSADNKHGTAAIFEELNLPRGPSADMIEMDQRQRIFEEVIISRIKVVQDFVKQRYAKMNKDISDLK